MKSHVTEYCFADDEKLLKRVNGFLINYMGCSDKVDRITILIDRNPDEWKMQLGMTFKDNKKKWE